MTTRAVPLLLLALVGALVVLASSLAPTTHADWSRGSGAASRARAADLVDRLPDTLRVTYYVSARRDLPATHDDLPEAVRDTLEDLFADAPDVRVVTANPDEHPAWSSFLSAAGVRPTRARAVERDGWTEERLWSSVRIESGPGPAAVWNGLGPDDLALLAPWVLGRLEQLSAPRAPRLAVDAPASYGLLRARLADTGDVRSVDLATDSLDDVDLLLWVDPSRATAAHLARLDAFRASGGAVVLAGSAWTAREFEEDGAAHLELSRSSFRAADAFAHFGLTADSLPLFDERFLGDANASAEPRPWRVRCIAPNQDFREFSGQPNGDLPFVAPTALRLDPAALAERGLRGTVIASAGDASWSPPTDEGSFPLERWNALPRRANALAPLAAHLQPIDAWSGSIALFGSASPFSDEALAERAGPATRLLTTLVDTLASDERLVRRGLAGERPAPLPELEPTARLAWRAVVIGAIPLVLALSTAVLRRGRRRGPRALRAWIPVGATFVVLAFLVPRLAATSLAVGGTDSAASAADVFRRLAPDARGPVQVATLFSFEADLPPELRGAAAEAEDWCRALAQAVPGITYAPMRSAREGALPGDLDVEPLSFSSTLDERTTLRRVYSHLLIDGTHGWTAIPLESLDALRDLPFRLALALDELANDRPRTLAVLANPPRLSPAEVELLYARRGLHAPRGRDAYAVAFDALRASGFALEWLDRDAPAIATDADAVLWLQPRRDTGPMSVALADHLARGGRAIVAGQHHRVIARQRDDAEGELRFWPQPQFCDLDSGYLPALGAGLAREVFCDPLFAALDVPTQVETTDGTDVRVQSSAQPFFLRVPAANRVESFGDTSDLLLPGGNRWRLDRNLLRRRGLSSRVLATSSSRSWAYAWEGGDLPDGALEGRADAAGVQRFPDKQALAVELVGSFPRAEVVLERGPDGRERARLLVDEVANGPAGRLVLIGGSEGFSDDYVTAGGSRGDRALLATVADLAVPKDVAALLPRDGGARGFDYVEPSTRLRWRAVVVGLVPALLLLLALFGRARA